MEYLSCSSLEHCSHYCCEEHHGCYLIYKIFIFIFFLYGIDFSCFAKIFVGWPRLFRLVWLILIPAKLHNYYENSKGKKVPFQPITACDIHYDNSCTRYMKNFSCLHYTCSFITCVCCRKKTTEVLIQGCLLYHIHQDLWPVQKWNYSKNLIFCSPSYHHYFPKHFHQRTWELLSGRSLR